LAKHLGKGWTQSKISEIITKKRRITEIVAFDLADAFGTSAEFWMNLQSHYDLWKAAINHSFSSCLSYKVEEGKIEKPRSS
jgi:antitoxin HigA-1